MALALRKTRPLTLCPTILHSTENVSKKQNNILSLRDRKKWLPRMQKALNQIQWATRKLCTEAVGGSGQHLLETKDSAYSLWTEEHGDVTHPASSQMSPQPHLISSLGPSNLDLQQFPAGCASFLRWSDPVYTAVEWVIPSRSHWVPRPLTYPKSTTKFNRNPLSRIQERLALISADTFTKVNCLHIHTVCSPCLSALAVFPCLFSPLVPL